MMVEIQQLRKKFEGKDQYILEGINLALSEGEIVGLVGNSGSGKTTLLRLLAGLEEPSSGAVLFRGTPVPGPSQQLVAGHPSIRLVHQHFELAHRLSVYENVAQKLRHLHPEEQRERTLELLEVCRLSQLSESMVEQLSGGEKQRLALARPLAEGPELLLLDEPFSNLDPFLKEDIKETLFRYIRQQGIAAVIVSHDPKDALSLTDRLWVLQEGKVVQQGRPEEVYFRSASPEVARLFGKVNLLRQEDLAKVLQGEAQEFVHRFPKGSLIGIRPEAVNRAEGQQVHMKAEVVASSFIGIYSEVKLAVEESRILNAYLPSFYVLKPGQVICFWLSLEQLQFWVMDN